MGTQRRWACVRANGCSAGKSARPSRQDRHLLRVCAGRRGPPIPGRRFGHVAFYNSRDGYAWLAPHFVDLQRFAFPDFKVFETIYCTPMRNGNWTLLKYPFFNGHGYYLALFDPVNCDQHYCEFLTRVFRVQHAHGDAFTSSSVEPLVPTEQSGVYANRFSTPKKNVWTLFNANYRTARAAAACQPCRRSHVFRRMERASAASQHRGSAARLEIDLGPRAVGCVMQQLP